MSSWSNSKLQRGKSTTQIITPGKINEEAFPTLGQAATKNTKNVKPAAGNPWSLSKQSLVRNASSVGKVNVNGNAGKRSSLAQSQANSFAALDSESDMEDTPTAVDTPKAKSKSVSAGKKQTQTILTPPQTPTLPASPNSQHASFAASVGTSSVKSDSEEEDSVQRGRIVSGLNGKYLSAREYMNIVTPFDRQSAPAKSNNCGTFAFNLNGRVVEVHDTFHQHLKTFYAQSARLAPLSKAEELSFAPRKQLADYARYWDDLEP
jgi:hypothetical protein